MSNKMFTRNEAIAFCHQDRASAIRSIVDHIKKHEMELPDICTLLSEIADEGEAQSMVCKLRDEINPQPPLPTLQEQAVKDLAAKYATDNVSDVSKWTPQIQLKYNAFLAGHAQSSGEVEALRSKLQVAEKALNTIGDHIKEMGDDPIWPTKIKSIATEALQQIQEK